MDFNYLLDLSNNNTFLLKNYMEQNNLTEEKKYLIEKKYHDYIIELNSKNWQEMQYDNLSLNSD